MTYIVFYKVGSSEEVKLAQLDAEDIKSATEKAKMLFLELESVLNRKYTFIDAIALSGIRKIDALN